MRYVNLKMKLLQMNFWNLIVSALKWLFMEKLQNLYKLHMNIKNIYFKTQFWHIVIYHKWVKHIFLSKDIVFCDQQSIFTQAIMSLGNLLSLQRTWDWIQIQITIYSIYWFIPAMNCHYCLIKFSSYSSFLCFFLDFYFYAHEKRMYSLSWCDPTTTNNQKPSLCLPKNENNMDTQKRHDCLRKYCKKCIAFSNLSILFLWLTPNFYNFEKE